MGRSDNVSLLGDQSMINCCCGGSGVGVSMCVQKWMYIRGRTKLVITTYFDMFILSSVRFLTHIENISIVPLQIVIIRVKSWVASTMSYNRYSSCEIFIQRIDAQKTHIISCILGEINNCNHYLFHSSLLLAILLLLYNNDKYRWVHQESEGLLK